MRACVIRLAAAAAAAKREKQQSIYANVSLSLARFLLALLFLRAFFLAAVISNNSVCVYMYGRAPVLLGFLFPAASVDVLDFCGWRFVFVLGFFFLLRIFKCPRHRFRVSRECGVNVFA